MKSRFHFVDNCKQGVSHGYQYATRLQPQGSDHRHHGRSGPLQAQGSGGTVGGRHGFALGSRHVGGLDWFDSLIAAALTGGQTTVNGARPHYIAIPVDFVHICLSPMVADD